MIKRTTNKWFTNPEHNIFCKIIITPDDSTDEWIEIEEDEYLALKAQLEAELEVESNINN